jgi:Xaa-Pro aminopeptidase
VRLEPGYYADGKFGIRIESIVLAKKVNTPNRFGDVDYLGFEHVTMVSTFAEWPRSPANQVLVSDSSQTY